MRFKFLDRYFLLSKAEAKLVSKTACAGKFYIIYIKTLVLERGQSVGSKKLTNNFKINYFNSG